MNKIEEIKEKIIDVDKNLDWKCHINIKCKINLIIDELQPFLKTPEEELLIELGELISEQQHTDDWQFNDNSDVRKFTEICNKVKELENGN